jgi:splicing factor 3B subunit 3
MSFNHTKKEVHSISLSYLDTIPVCVSLVILRNGYLFAPAEKGNHMLFRFKGLAENEKIVSTSTDFDQAPIKFCPRAYENLELSEEINNLSVISDMKIKDLNSEGNA